MSKLKEVSSLSPISTPDQTPPTQTAHELLRIVRASQPIPRVAVARRLGVHRRRITVLVKPLIDSGVLREGAPERSAHRGVGRPPIGLSLRSDKDFLVGVNIGVSKIHLGAATVDGKILQEESFPTSTEPEIAIAEIRAAIERFEKRLPDRVLAVVGISVVGPTDAERSRLLYAPHLGWKDIPVAKLLNLDVPVLVENNATAAAIYESQRRRSQTATKTAGDFVVVRAGTGIGVGLVLGGEVFRGTSGADIAGEFGHMTIVAGGKSCTCGNFGCWERYASAASAVELYTGDSHRARLRSSLTFTDLVAKAIAGERRAQVTLERVGTHLGIGIGNMIGGLGVSNVVLSGELVHGWKFIEGSARAAIAMSMAGRLSRWSLEPGDMHGADLGGALEVAIEQYLFSVIGRPKAA
ncbi:MAG TPA: ROK family protein [Pyrinomonadaceae bacterium]